MCVMIIDKHESCPPVLSDNSHRRSFKGVRVSNEDGGRGVEVMIDNNGEE